MSLTTITIDLPANLDEDQVGRFSESLSELALSTSLVRLRHPFEGPWQVQWLIAEVPELGNIIATLSLAATIQGFDIGVPDIAPLPETNWLAESYRSFPPFMVGPFYIHGSHTADPVSEGMIDLQIDAATAFGSGEHGTTSGCLLLLDQLKQSGFIPGAILDMGCGSGILAIACCKLWDAPVCAVDIDPESIRVTQNHAAANNVTLTGIAGDGFAVVDGSYDLIIANILPGPLKAMAADAARCLNPSGFIILSGMLLEQVDDVWKTYESLGMRLITRLDRGEWTALLLKNK